MTRKQLHPIFVPIDEDMLLGGDGDAFRREQCIKDERIVTFIGRLCEMKDPMTFVRASPLLLQRRPGIRFLVVGGGALLPGLRDLANTLGLGNAISFTGARRDIGSILKASDVFVAVSPVTNCWSTTIAEAMFLGVPCVISDTGAEHRLLPHRDAAWLVPPRDPEALAAALDVVLWNRALALHLSEGGRDLLERNRREDDLIFEDTISLYKAVLQKHGHSRSASA